MVRSGHCDMSSLPIRGIINGYGRNACIPEPSFSLRYRAAWQFYVYLP